MNLSNRKWVNEGASFLQVYASGGIGWNKNSQKLIDMDCPLSYIVVHWAMRGGGLRKTWSEKHLAVTFGTPCPLMSVMRTSIIWLSLFHRSLVISLHAGTKQCSVKPRGLFSLCVIRFMSFMCGILVYTSRCTYTQTDIENHWSSSP